MRHLPEHPWPPPLPWQGRPGAIWEGNRAAAGTRGRAATRTLALTPKHLHDVEVVVVEWRGTRTILMTTHVITSSRPFRQQAS